PFQRKLFQSWTSGWKIAATLLLTAISPVAGFLLYAAGRLYTFPVFFDLLVTYLGFVIMVASGPFFYLRARRLATLNATDLRKKDERPPLIFLRSFQDDQIEFSTLFRRRVRLEEDIVQALSFYGPVIALGKPGESVAPLGAAREYISDQHWKERIREYISDSNTLVMILGNTGGLEWEVKTIAAVGAINKLIVIVPPKDRNDISKRWEMFTSWTNHFCRVRGEIVINSALLIRLAGQENPVVITSKSRREGDYYEAIRNAQLGQQSEAS
ncbi:hypothetical protein C6A37_06220, partial [Desulfobacteraceae bacterium SEEP-SAG9]